MRHSFERAILREQMPTTGSHRVGGRTACRRRAGLRDAHIRWVGAGRARMMADDRTGPGRAGDGTDLDEQCQGYGRMCARTLAALVHPRFRHRQRSLLSARRDLGFIIADGEGFWAEVKRVAVVLHRRRRTLWGEQGPFGAALAAVDEKQRDAVGRAPHHMTSAAAANAPEVFAGVRRSGAVVPIEWSRPAGSSDPDAVG